MNYWALLGSSVWTLLRNRMRSVLTVLGITIGIAAVICVVAIGKAGQARVEQQLNNLGDNFVWIEAGGRAVNGRRTGTHATKSLTVADAVAIGKQIPLIKAESPNVDGSIQIVYRGSELVHGVPWRIPGILRHPPMVLGRRCVLLERRRAAGG